MSTRKIPFLEKGHAEILRKTDSFRKTLTNLHYEGKPFVGRNLKQTRELTVFLTQEVLRHFKLEEKILFPFLKKHIPKLEPVIRFLEVEHADFRMQLKNFQKSLRRLSKSRGNLDRGEITEKIRDLGIYMIYFLRNHVQAEDGTLYKAVCRDLRADEGRQLQRQFGQAIKKIKNKKEISK